MIPTQNKSNKDCPHQIEQVDEVLGVVQEISNQDEKHKDKKVLFNSQSYASVLEQESKQKSEHYAKIQFDTLKSRPDLQYRRRGRPPKRYLAIAHRGSKGRTQAHARLPVGTNETFARQPAFHQLWGKVQESRSSCIGSSGPYRNMNATQQYEKGRQPALTCELQQPSSQLHSLQSSVNAPKGVDCRHEAGSSAQHAGLSLKQELANYTCDASVESQTVHKRVGGKDILQSHQLKAPQLHRSAIANCIHTLSEMGQPSTMVEGMKHCNRLGLAISPRHLGHNFGLTESQFLVSGRGKSEAAVRQDAERSTWVGAGGYRDIKQISVADVHATMPRSDYQMPSGRNMYSTLSEQLPGIQGRGMSGQAAGCKQQGTVCPESILLDQSLPVDKRLEQYEASLALERAKVELQIEELRPYVREAVLRRKVDVQVSVEVPQMAHHAMQGKQLPSPFHLRGMSVPEAQLMGPALSPINPQLHAAYESASDIGAGHPQPIAGSGTSFSQLKGGMLYDQYQQSSQLQVVGEQQMRHQLHNKTRAAQSRLPNAASIPNSMAYADKDSRWPNDAAQNYQALGSGMEVDEHGRVQAPAEATLPRVNIRKEICADLDQEQTQTKHTQKIEDSFGLLGSNSMKDLQEELSKLAD